jgi:hypothetical protein
LEILVSHGRLFLLFPSFEVSCLLIAVAVAVLFAVLVAEFALIFLILVEHFLFHLF